MAAPLKASQFNHFTPAHLPGTVIGFNAYTGGYFSVDEIEFRRIRKRFANLAYYGRQRADPLIARLEKLGFLIPADFDERAHMRAQYATSKVAPKGLSLTLAPTVSCNFACSYCFEEHPKRHMSEADIENIRAYVDANLREGEYLSVTWFGGEPLAKFPVIKTLNTLFNQISSERDCDYTQSIITNGSLLTEERIAYFHDQGNLQYVQITLDGPQDVHDTRRPTALGRGTFERIMETLRRIEGRLPVALRVNVDLSNLDRVPDLIDRIAGEPFASSVSMYFGHVVSYTEACDDQTSQNELSVEEFADCEAKLMFRILQAGMRPAVSLPQPSRGNICVADHARGAVVSPGSIKFGCWNETALPASEASGELADGRIIVEEHHRQRHEEWSDYDPFAHAMCQTCDVQPLCRGGCPWEARKHPVESTGHCTPLRYNLAERLRLYHLVQSIDGTQPAELRLPEPCA